MTGRSNRLPGSTAGTAAFTLVELLVVMGMLSVFLMFLTQILSDALTVWQRGEERVSLEDRAASAIDMVTSDLPCMTAVSDRQFASARTERFERTRNRAGAPALSGRLYAQWIPFLPNAKPAPEEVAGAQPGACDWFPEVRFVCTLDGGETAGILRARVAQEIRDSEGAIDPDEMRQRVADRLRDIPPRHPAELALRVLPTGEENGCYLALFRQRRLLLPGAKGRWVDGAALPAPSTALLSNLLYVEFLFRSQYTESFAARRGSKGAPEHCWDSARAGTFPSDHTVLGFTLDLDPSSLADPLDDVMPSAVEARIVVDQGPGLAYTAFLANKVDAKSVDLRVEYPERLPLPEDQPYLKIGGEWIHYSGIDGSRLIGVRRGMRFTKPRQHEGGARVHAGKEVSIRVPIVVAREYWNG